MMLAINSLMISQVKIGDNPTSIDPNSVLEIESMNKGLLMPRVPLISTTTTTPLSANVAGMTVYNTATRGDVTPGSYYNNGTKWIKVADEANMNYYISTEDSSNISTSSATDVAISGMTLSPPAGTYVIMFNGQYASTSGQSSTFNTSQAARDLELIYNQLITIPVTNTTHASTFGSAVGETLAPGVYTIGSTVTVTGTLTLDGGGNPNALFIIRATGVAAINTVAGTTIILANGAKANNVFWVAGGAVTLGESTTMLGTILSHPGAVNVGNLATVEGRMFSSAGGMNFDTNTLWLPNPSTTSYVDYRSLRSFVIYSSAGALTNAGNSTVTGDIGTNSGAITGFGSPSTLNGTEYPAGSTITSTINAIAAFSIYKNGVLLANSTRKNSSNTAPILLQSVATILAGETIDIRWKIDVGPLTMENRILTLGRVQHLGLK